MPVPLAFVYHDVFDGRGFSRLSGSWRRYRLARELFRDVGLLPPLVEVCPEPATDAEILRAHAPEHLARVREADRRGTGFLDYGDTPAWPGVLRRATLAVGGTLRAARLVGSGEFRRAFNPAGGLHHARRNRAGGFCPFNDVVVAVRALQAEFGYRRIAVVDLDGHHGDGTEELLYAEPILTISLHRYGGRFYPGTGAPADVGAGAGFGYNLNVPLERGTDGETYLAVFDRWVVPALRRYLPRVIIVLVGADTHYADPLVRLGLTLPAYHALARRLAALSDELCGGKLIALAGGGYSPEHVARAWAVFVGALADAWEPEDGRLEELFREDAESPAAPSPGRLDHE
jgi:acetoin utilization protein AcuC